MAVQFHVYQDRAGAFRWRLVDQGNGRLIADSGEAYSRRTDAIRAVQNVIGDIHRDAHAIADTVLVEPNVEA